MSKIKEFKLNIPYLNETRRIQVYLPKNYSNNKEFPVIYFHDGQNIFDATNSFSGHSWGIKETLDQFYSKHQKGIIAVAIDNAEANRMNEYSPWLSINFQELLPEWNADKFGGLGENYNTWIINTLVPYINQNFKTNNQNTIIGSSMGGYISLYVGYKNSKIFKAIVSLSTAIWFNKQALFDYLEKQINPNTLLYFDIGTNETSGNLDEFPQIYLKDTIELEKLVQRHNVKNYKCVIDEGAQHSELEWNKRMPKILEWLLENKAV